MISMKTRVKAIGGHSRCAAFTLVEVMIASITFAVVLAAGNAALIQGFRMTAAAREELRATQILQDRSEILRLYTWDQLTNSGFVPLTFTESFNTAGAAHGNGGVTYHGTVTISQAPVTTESYSNDLRLVSFQLNWTNNNISHQRTLTTLDSSYGLHNYIY
jgi:type II secretory pathway pseudopilin PulG